MCRDLQALGLGAVRQMMVAGHLLKVPAPIVTLNFAAVEEFLQSLAGTRVVAVDVRGFCGELGGVQPQYLFVGAAGLHLIHLLDIEGLPIRVAVQALTQQPIESVRGFVAVFNLLARHVGDLEAEFNLSGHL